MCSEFFITRIIQGFRACQHGRLIKMLKGDGSMGFSQYAAIHFSCEGLKT